MGLYLSGHPIDEHLAELKQIAPTRLVNLRPERGGQIAAGLLHGFRTMKSKSGDTIAFLTLDDRSARFEVSLFAKEYEKYRDLIQKDEILIIECSVSVDDYSGGMKGRARQLMTLEQARRKYASQLTLQLESKALPVNFCELLESILMPYCQQAATLGATGTTGGGHPAAAAMAREELAPAQPCRVLINLQRADSKGCIILGEDWQVTPADELIERLKSEFGRTQVGLKYSKSSLNQKSA